MNKTKKVAAIAFIVFVIASLAAIVAAPFAVKSSIAYYNQLVDEAAASQSQMVEKSALPETVKTINLTMNSWARVQILPSENGRIYFELYNAGMKQAQLSEVTVLPDGSAASVVLEITSDKKITKENVHMLMLASINEYSPHFVRLYLPQDATLNVTEDYWLDSFSFGSTPFANREQLMAQAGILAGEETDLSYYISRLSDLRSTITAYKLPNRYEEYAVHSVSDFHQETYNLYQEISNCRRDMLREVYGSFYKKTVPSSDYLLADELTQAEKERDLLEVRLNDIYEDMKNGQITPEMYVSLKAEQEEALKLANATVQQLESQFNAICFPNFEVTAQQAAPALDQDSAASEQQSLPADIAPLEPVAPAE